MLAALIFRVAFDDRRRLRWRRAPFGRLDAEQMAHVVPAVAPIVAGVREGDEAIGRGRGQADAQAAVARTMAGARTKHLVASAIAAKAPGVVAQGAHGSAPTRRATASSAARMSAWRARLMAS